MKKLLLLAAFAAMANLACASGGAGTAGTIKPADAKALLAADKTVILLDVRSAEEYAGGHIAGARLQPYDRIDAATAAAHIPAKDATVVVYCRSGHRSGLAAKTLLDLGYTKVLDLGGLMNWPYETVTGDSP